MKLLTLLGLVAAAYSQNCGQTPIPPNESKYEPGALVINGEDAKPFSWPWQVSICAMQPGEETENTPCRIFCGGTVIDNNYVLTAGHCVDFMLDNPDRFNYIVRAGIFNTDTDLPATDSDVQEREIAEKILHPDYVARTAKNDVGVLKLSAPLTYGDRVQPVCLAKDPLPVEEGLHAIGWGKTMGGDEGQVSKTLKQVVLQSKSRTTCRLAAFFVFDETKICGGGDADLKGICNGDSGGPWQLKHSDGRWRQYGINSFVLTSQCVREGSPAYFARVSRYCDYLAGIVGSEVCF